MSSLGSVTSLAFAVAALALVVWAMGVTEENARSVYNPAAAAAYAAQATD